MEPVKHDFVKFTDMHAVRKTIQQKITCSNIYCKRMKPAFTNETNVKAS